MRTLILSACALAVLSGAALAEDAPAAAPTASAPAAPAARPAPPITEATVVHLEMTLNDAEIIRMAMTKAPMPLEVSLPVITKLDAQVNAQTHPKP